MSKFTPQLAQKIAEDIGTGNNNIKDVCAKHNITFQTYSTWKKEKPVFSDLIKKAEDNRLESFKEMALTGLATLIQKHEVIDKQEEWSERYDDKGKKLKPIRKSWKTTTKTILPTPSAVIFTLCNLDSVNFQNIQRVDHTSKGDKVETPISAYSLSEQTLRELAGKGVIEKKPGKKKS